MLSLLPVVHGVHASRDWHWVPVHKTWAIGPVDGVVGITAGVPCAWCLLQCAAIAVVVSQHERLTCTT